MNKTSQRYWWVLEQLNGGLIVTLEGEVVRPVEGGAIYTGWVADLYAHTVTRYDKPKEIFEKLYRETLRALIDK